MTIKLPNPIGERLRQAAEREGVSADAYAARLIESQLAAEPDHETLRLLEQWDKEDATGDAGEVARRNEQFEKFRQSMNESSGRTVYP